MLYTTLKLFVIAGALVAGAPLVPPGGDEGSVHQMRRQGDKGDRGDTGAKGDKGDTGPAGPAGQDGADGLPGPAGQDGADGLPGPAGATFTINGAGSGTEVDVIKATLCSTFQDDKAFWQHSGGKMSPTTPAVETPRPDQQRCLNVFRRGKLKYCNRVYPFCRRMDPRFFHCRRTPSAKVFWSENIREGDTGKLENYPEGSFNTSIPQVTPAIPGSWIPNSCGYANPLGCPVPDFCTAPRSKKIVG